MLIPLHSIFEIDSFAQIEIKIKLIELISKLVLNLQSSWWSSNHSKWVVLARMTCSSLPTVAKHLLHIDIIFYPEFQTLLITLARYDIILSRCGNHSEYHGLLAVGYQKRIINGNVMIWDSVLVLIIIWCVSIHNSRLMNWYPSAMMYQISSRLEILYVWSRKVTRLQISWFTRKFCFHKLKKSESFVETLNTWGVNFG